MWLPAHGYKRRGRRQKHALRRNRRELGRKAVLAATSRLSAHVIKRSVEFWAVDRHSIGRLSARSTGDTPRVVAQRWSHLRMRCGRCSSLAGAAHVPREHGSRCAAGPGLLPRSCALPSMYLGQGRLAARFVGVRERPRLRRFEAWHRAGRRNEHVVGASSSSCLLGPSDLCGLRRD